MVVRHKRSRYRRPGMPEAVAVVLFVAIIGIALLTLRANLSPRLVAAPGAVIHATLIDLPYSGSPEPDQIEMEYEYRVEGQRYTGHFKGFWPQGGALNALPREEWPQLTQAGFPLTVMIDPANPTFNLLHHRESFSPQMLNWLAIVGLAVTLFYLMRVYPRWKLRQ